MSLVLLEINGGIATVTVNRPEYMNSLTLDTVREIDRAFGAIEDDPSVVAAILTGAGDKAFIAGVDLSVMLTLDQRTAQAGSRMGQIVCDRIAYCKAPVIAAVNGVAYGGGMEFALACDIRVASENAMFGQQEVLWGNFPGWGGTQRLPGLVGRSDAMKMILTGDPINAAEAYRIGLVSDVYPPGEFQERVLALAKKIVKNGPDNVRYAKKAVAEGCRYVNQSGLSLENELWGLCFTSDEPRKRVERFFARGKK
ncbi:MAG: crotonase [Firmicutes bacterium]|nr:crotonase [Bacillota bacterium]